MYPFHLYLSFPFSLIPPVLIRVGGVNRISLPPSTVLPVVAPTPDLIPSFLRRLSARPFRRTPEPIYFQVPLVGEVDLAERDWSEPRRVLVSVSFSSWWTIEILFARVFIQSP